MAGIKAEIKITDMDFFKDIIALLNDLAKDDESIQIKLAEIFIKHKMINNDFVKEET